MSNWVVTAEGKTIQAESRTEALKEALDYFVDQLNDELEEVVGRDVPKKRQRQLKMMCETLVDAMLDVACSGSNAMIRVRRGPIDLLIEPSHVRVLSNAKR